ncbi:hypothetical protein CC1G_11600 [Coprinopsis cinerea okayama7|uniref:Uncharacterized protein n=1 Tax=Coprinopsis cinerea (strain Okayama-7 / 130 / ATCC MYA-4618 / FGSC 9003) TaxID=240176 RepID=A8NMM6_COPC7|nr:hypothetical protein CC1G_11600 [Coprinopsis cinerea okayama7\|eukprot:XP_001834951.2 hypothetical protein CC1G_11600 [Coprinopsis cinerea okayama7\
MPTSPSSSSSSSRLTVPISPSFSTDSTTNAPHSDLETSDDEPDLGAFHVVLRALTDLQPYHHHRILLGAHSSSSSNISTAPGSGSESRSSRFSSNHDVDSDRSSPQSQSPSESSSVVIVPSHISSYRPSSSISSFTHPGLSSATVDSSSRPDGDNQIPVGVDPRPSTVWENQPIWRYLANNPSNISNSHSRPGSDSPLSNTSHSRRSNSPDDDASRTVEISSDLELDNTNTDTDNDNPNLNLPTREGNISISIDTASHSGYRQSPGVYPLQSLDSHHHHPADVSFSEITIPLYSPASAPNDILVPSNDRDDISTSTIRRAQSHSPRDLLPSNRPSPSSKSSSSLFPIHEMSSRSTAMNSEVYTGRSSAGSGHRITNGGTAEDALRSLLQSASASRSSSSSIPASAPPPPTSHPPSSLSSHSSSSSESHTSGSGTGSRSSSPSLITQPPDTTPLSATSEVILPLALPVYGPHPEPRLAYGTGHPQHLSNQPTYSPHPHPQPQSQPQTVYGPTLHTSVYTSRIGYTPPSYDPPSIYNPQPKGYGPTYDYDPPPPSSTSYPNYPTQSSIYPHSDRELTRTPESLRRPESEPPSPSNTPTSTSGSEAFPYEGALAGNTRNGLRYARSGVAGANSVGVGGNVGGGGNVGALISVSAGRHTDRPTTTTGYNPSSYNDNNNEEEEEEEWDARTPTRRKSGDTLTNAHTHTSSGYAMGSHLTPSGHVHVHTPGGLTPSRVHNGGKQGPAASGGGTGRLTPTHTYSSLASSTATATYTNINPNGSTAAYTNANGSTISPGTGTSGTSPYVTRPSRSTTGRSTSTSHPHTLLGLHSLPPTLSYRSPYPLGSSGHVHPPGAGYGNKDSNSSGSYYKAPYTANTDGASYKDTNSTSSSSYTYPRSNDPPSTSTSTYAYAYPTHSSNLTNHQEAAAEAEHPTLGLLDEALSFIAAERARFEAAKKCASTTSTSSTAAATTTTTTPDTSDSDITDRRHRHRQQAQKIRGSQGEGSEVGADGGVVGEVRGGAVEGGALGEGVGGGGGVEAKPPTKKRRRKRPTAPTAAGKADGEGQPAGDVDPEGAGQDVVKGVVAERGRTRHQLERQQGPTQLSKSSSTSTIRGVFLVPPSSVSSQAKGELGHVTTTDDDDDAEGDEVEEEDEVDEQEEEDRSTSTKTSTPKSKSSKKVKSTGKSKPEKPPKPTKFSPGSITILTRPTTSTSTLSTGQTKGVPTSAVSDVNATSSGVATSSRLGSGADSLGVLATSLSLVTRGLSSTGGEGSKDADIIRSEEGVIPSFHNNYDDDNVPGKEHQLGEDDPLPPINLTGKKGKRVGRREREREKARRDAERLLALSSEISGEAPGGADSPHYDDTSHNEYSSQSHGTTEDSSHDESYDSTSSSSLPGNSLLQPPPSLRSGSRTPRLKTQGSVGTIRGVYTGVEGLFVSEGQSFVNEDEDIIKDGDEVKSAKAKKKAKTKEKEKVSSTAEADSAEVPKAKKDKKDKKVRVSKDNKDKDKEKTKDVSEPTSSKKRSKRSKSLILHHAKSYPNIRLEAQLDGTSYGYRSGSKYNAIERGKSFEYEDLTHSSYEDVLDQSKRSRLLRLARQLLLAFPEQKRDLNKVIGRLEAGYAGEGQAAVGGGVVRGETAPIKGPSKKGHVRSSSASATTSGGGGVSVPALEFEEEPQDPAEFDILGAAHTPGASIVHVFIDHSNILIGLLNFLKRHPPPQHIVEEYLASHTNWNTAKQYASGLGSGSMAHANAALSSSSSAGSSNEAPASSSSKSKSKGKSASATVTALKPSSKPISIPSASAKHDEEGDEREGGIPLVVESPTDAFPIALPSWVTAAFGQSTGGTNAPAATSKKKKKKSDPRTGTTSLSKSLPNTSYMGLARGALSDSDNQASSDPSKEHSHGGAATVAAIPPRKPKFPRHLWHAALALILERGRPVSRRVVVTSSPLYQPMDKIQALGYEVRVYIRVPDLGDGMDRREKESKYGHGHGYTGKPNVSFGPSSPSSSTTTTASGASTAVATTHRNSHTRRISSSSLSDAASGSPSKKDLTSSSSTSSVPHANVDGGSGGGTPAGGGSTAATTTPARIRYREQGVDELLQLKLHQALADVDKVPKGSTIVLATGDGNVGQFSEDGFIGPVRTALKRGWKVELYAWEDGLSKVWRREFGPNSEWGKKGLFKVLPLEPFATSLVEAAGW